MSLSGEFRRSITADLLTKNLWQYLSVEKKDKVAPIDIVHCVSNIFAHTYQLIIFIIHNFKTSESKLRYDLHTFSDCLKKLYQPIIWICSFFRNGVIISYCDIRKICTIMCYMIQIISKNRTFISNRPVKRNIILSIKE